MGTQHRPRTRAKALVLDEDWEHLDAPMFCDFSAPEFKGTRLGGQVTDDTSSGSSFFNRTCDGKGTLL